MPACVMKGVTVSFATLALDQCEWSIPHPRHSNVCGSRTNYEAYLIQSPRPKHVKCGRDNLQMHYLS